MNQQILSSLERLFEKHRIVFWYDGQKELKSDYDALSLPGVEKIELASNEFGVKHRILREEPEQKFLLYREGPQPADLDNWLLDVQLAHGEFRTDQVSIWLGELDLGIEFGNVIEPHAEFFKAQKRIDSLKRLLTPTDTESVIKLKMLAVCACGDPRVEAILECLLEEMAEEKDEKARLIQRCDLDSFLWEQLKRYYGYTPDKPSLKDFIVELFKSCYAMEVGGEVNLNSDALVFLKRWKDNRKCSGPFETLSKECAEVLNVQQDLEGRDFRGLIEVDFFRLIDQKIICELVGAIVSQTVSAADVNAWVRQRRQGYWYSGFEDIYEALDYAARFFQVLGEVDLGMTSLADGAERYSQSWYQLDQLYRKFLSYIQRSRQPSLLADLSEKIENLYTNNFLMKINDIWQGYVDDAEQWGVPNFPLQSEFFPRYVQPYLNKTIKVAVVISDAFRYEIGNELLKSVMQEDRFHGELEPMLSMIPSYTQLGMAALLPHKELAIANGETSQVLVDGRSSQGTANRQKVLENALSQRARVLKAEDLLTMKGNECREIVRENDVLYIYHNRIDATGDKRDQEGRVFEAVDETLEELVLLLKKLASANATNVLVTADHGFIYQNRPIDESDFLGEDVLTGDVLFRDRRFVLGHGMKKQDGLRHFNADDVGLKGDVEVQIPKSINRLRLKGSGSRFVHGGTALQEVVVPVLKVSKKRQSDTSVVGVEILRSGSSLITSGQLSVALYQEQAASEKVQPRKLRAGIYTEAGVLISDQHELVFDLESESPREREMQVRFVLSRKADEANGQEVLLKLEEQHAGTSHYKEYKTQRYVMRRSFTTDFDF